MKKILEYIEDKNILINKDWYYHATPFSYDIYKSILSNGILSPYLLSNHNSSYRYVFVSRGNNNKYSAFSNYSIYPNFIINGNIDAINSKDNFIKKLIYGGFHNLNFTSLYDDEYQVYKKINPEDIIGILFNLEKLITTYHEESSYYLNILCDLVFLLKQLGITIPIIDYYSSKEINKQKVLSLVKKEKLKCIKTEFVD